MKNIEDQKFKNFCQIQPRNLFLGRKSLVFLKRQSFVTDKATKNHGGNHRLVKQLLVCMSLCQFTTLYIYRLRPSLIPAMILRFEFMGLAYI